MDFLVFKSFLPEVFLNICLLGQLTINPLLIKNNKNNTPILYKEIFLQTFFILISVLLLLLNSKVEGYFNNLLFINENSSYIVKIILVISSIFVLFIAFNNFKFQKLNLFEFFSLYLFVILASLLIISSADMLSAYLVIEMQALTFYVLASFKRDSIFSTEAGLKYFITGAFFSALLLLGCSFFYFFFGTLNFTHLIMLTSFPIQNLFLGHEANLLFLGAFCIISTFFFKLGVAPFHFWVPDVYEGSPLASTIIFAVLPKIAIVYFFSKWLTILIPLYPVLTKIFVVIGVVTIIIGIFFALIQKRVKKFIIYSSIAQMGFVILALGASNGSSYVAVFFFLIIYIITSILVWNHISLFYYLQQNILNFYNKSGSVLYLTNLVSLFKDKQLWSFSFALIFFSIIGLPPLSGFFAKVLVLYSVLQTENIFFTFLIVVVNITAVYYYLRVLKILFFEPKKKYVATISYFFVQSDTFLITSYINAFLLFLLIFFFIEPTFPVLICYKIVFGTIHFL